MQAESVQKNLLGLQGISFSLSQNNDEHVLELSAECGHLSRLRHVLAVCRENLPVLLKSNDLQIAMVSPDPELVIELPDVKLSEGEEPDQRLFKFVLAGSFASGKSSVMRRYVNNTYTFEKATIGIDFRNKELMLAGTQCKFQIWDTAGADRFRGYVRVYFRGSTAIILTLDLTRPFSEVESAIREVLRHVDFSGCFLIAVGTKCDNPYRKIDRVTAELFADKLGVPYMECSAKDNINISELFTTVTKMALLQRLPKYVFKMNFKNIDPALFLEPRLYDQLNRLVQPDLVKDPTDEVADVYLRFYRKAVRFLQEAGGENVFAVQRLHIKYCRSENEFIEEEAAAAVQKMDDDVLVQVIIHFRRALTSQSHADRDEAREGLRHLNQLNSPEVIQICTNTLREISVDAGKRAVKILKKIDELSVHQLVEACFEPGYTWDENMGVKSDAFRLLVEIKADHVVDDVKNRVLQALLAEAELQRDEKAIQILVIKKHGVVPVEVAQVSGKRPGVF